MNYYEHHIGDYAEATAHLTFVEDAAYSRLIRKYYAQEKPLPADVKAVQRLIAARSKEEREAVVTVLEEFFTLEGDGWHNHRCDEELRRYHAKAEGRDEKREAEKERQRRHRQRRKELFETLMEYGVTPAFDTSTEELITILSRVTNTDESQPVTQPVTRDATATQSPDTSNQTPVTIKPLDQPPRALTTPGPGKSVGAGCSPGEISKAMRAAGVQSQPADPRIIALAEQGVSLETVTAACDEGKRSKPGERLGVGYVVAILQRWAKEAAAVDVSGAEAPDKAGKEPPDEWWRNNAGIERKGRELGMVARGTESYNDFKDRIFSRLREGGKAA